MELNKKLPKKLKSLFWDIDFESLDKSKKAYFIINRIFEKGDIEAVKWARQNYSEEAIRFSLINLRDFSLRSATFWATIYDIPFTEILCLQEPYLSTRQQLWPH